MARGFATGLFHGALTGVVGLTALSLLLPAPPADVQGLAPDAGVIATPSGSEFGRGDDTQPLLPAPLTRPIPAPLGGAAAVDAPADGADAPLTDASTLTAARPETRAEDPLAPPEIAPATVDADIPTAPAGDRRAAPVAPQRFESPAPDVEPLPVAAPEQGPDSDPAQDGAPAATPLPIARPGLPVPPAAESPADMSALTRGRPEDGLGATQAVHDDRADDANVSSDEAVPNTGAPVETPPTASAPAAPDAAETDPSPFDDATTPDAQATVSGGPTGESEPDVSAAPEAPSDSEPLITPSPAADADQPDSAEDLPEPQAMTPDAAEADARAEAVSDPQAAETQPSDPLAPARAEPGSDAPVESQPATAAAMRSFPAMNLSTPPDISGLLSGQ